MKHVPLSLRLLPCLGGVLLSFVAGGFAGGEETGPSPSALPVGPIRAREEPPGPADREPAPVPGPKPARPAAAVPAPPAKDETVITFGRMEQWRQGPYTVIYLSDGVEITKGSNVTTADTIVVWSGGEAQAETSGGRGRGVLGQFDQLYAEGNVRLDRPGKGQIHADRVFLDMRRGEGLFIDFRFRTVSHEGRPAVVLRAEEARQVSEDFFVAQPATVTTCTYGTPHYDVHVRRLEFAKDPDGPAGVLGMEDLVMRVDGMPLAYWPSMTRDLGSPMILRGMSLSRTSRFGTSVLSEWGGALTRDETDAEGKPILDKYGHPKQRKWADLAVNVDWREQRGWATGFNLKYKEEDRYLGFVETYYLKDDGRNLGNAFDRSLEASSPLVHDDRGRVHAFHRQFLSAAWRLDTEVNYISDRDLLLEFFPREQSEGKEPESYGYLRGVYDNWGFTLLQKNRLNDWQTQTEYMPQVQAIGMAEPVSEDAIPGLYFFTTTDATNVRRQFDRALHPITDSVRIWRFDSANELWYPLHAGPVNLAPFVGGRWSLYQQSLVDNATVDRFVAAAGARVEVQAHRVYDVDWNFVGLHGLRHEVSAEVRYANNYADTVPSRDLVQYDGVDAVDKFQEVAWRLNQRFQTKTGPEDDRRIVDFLTLRTEIETYPDALRDTGRSRAQNYLPPFHWITLSPQPDGTFEERTYSNLFWGADLLPEATVSLYLNGEYNPKDRHPEVAELTSYYTLVNWWRLGVGYYSAHAVTESVTFTSYMSPTPRVNLFVQNSRDLLLGRSTGQRVGVQWDLHDAFFEVLVQIDPIRDDKQYLIGLTPKFTGRSRSILSDSSGAERSRWSGSGGRF